MAQARDIHIWAGCLILFTLILRVLFVYSGQLDLVQDEAQYWDWSRTPQLSYFTKGPLVAYIIGISTWIFGDGVMAVRLGAMVCATFTQIVLYTGLAISWGKPRLGLSCLIIFNTLIIFQVSGILMTTDSPLLLCWTVGFFTLGEAVKNPGRQWPYVVLCLAVAMGILAKYMMLAFIPCAFLFGFVLYKKRELPSVFWQRLVPCLLVGSVLGLLPIVLWNMQNDFVGLKHVLHQGGMAGSRAKSFFNLHRFPEYVGSQLGVFYPWWLFMAVYGAVAGFFSLFGRQYKVTKNLSVAQSALLTTFFWPVWGFFLVWSLHTKVNANWSAVSYIAGLILAAVFWDRLWDIYGGKNWKVWLWPLIGAVFVLIALVHDWLPVPRTVTVPGLKKTYEVRSPALRLKGFSDLGQKVGILRAEKFQDPEHVFLFGLHYDMTSVLSYNVPGQERAFCGGVHRRLNQYDLWPGPENLKGYDAVFVRKKFRSKVHEDIKPLFERIEMIHFQSEHKGKPAQKFTIYLCYGFKGKWPRPAPKAF